MKVFLNQLAPLLLLLGLACEKTSNVGPLQDEAAGLTSHYKVRFDDLQKRVSLLEAKGRSMGSIGQPQGMIEVRKLFLDTTKRLNELKSAVTQASGQINLALKSEQPRTELIKLTGEMRERFDRGATEVTAGLDQVEGWLAYVEFRPRAEPPPTDKSDDKPDGAGGGGADASKPDDRVGADAVGDAKPADKKDDKKPDAKPADKKDDKKDVKKDDKKTDDKKAGAGSAVKVDAKPDAKGSAAKPAAAGSNK